MIVRILAEGQWDVADAELDRLNALDAEVEAAVETGDHETFAPCLTALLDAVREAGSPLADESLVDSDLILPPSDATLEEVRELLGEDGLIPGLMAGNRFINDRGLTARMTLVMFLLGGVFVAFIVVLMAVASRSGYGGLIPLIGIAGIGFAWFQWYNSDTLALKAMRARVVTPEEAPELHGMVDRLCALADMPKPRVAIAYTDLPNAFATGRSADHSAVCVTTGILDKLTAEELEGVLAHELSHVAHRDVLVMTVAASAGIVAGMATRGAQYGAIFGGGGRRDNNNNNNGLPIWLVVLVVSLVVYVVSFFLTRLLSRYRELCADRSGAYLTQKPAALASALTKLSGEVAAIPSKDLREVQSMNAFFITPAISGLGMRTLTSTHPSLEQRLEQLAKVSAELGKAG